MHKNCSQNAQKLQKNGVDWVDLVAVGENLEQKKKKKIGEGDFFRARVADQVDLGGVGNFRK
jgi:hypothetical protein